MNATAATLGSGSYESPKTDVLEISTEGVFCASFEKYDEDVLDW